MAKEVTLADIAEKVGVSKVAVSKALSGKPGVSDELREKIKQIAQQTGYVSRSSKTTEYTGNIGVIVPEHYYGYSISFYGQFYEKVVKALYNNSYYGILELLTKEDEAAGKIPKVIEDRKVDGVIFLGQIDEKYIVKMINQTRLPVYFLDTYVPDIEFDTVISDGYYGTYMLTNYLINQGFKKIGFIGSVDATSSIADRYWGYRRALREKNIKYDESWEVPDRDKKGKSLDRVLSKDNLLPAYVCNCDYTAHLVMQELDKNGIKVPEDVSLVGFDNFIPLGLGMDADKITTYEVDMNLLAEACVKSLIKKIKHIKYNSGIQIITGRIVVKKSVRQCN